MFEIEQATVESQGRFNVTDLESNMIETGYRAFVASDIELLQFMDHPLSVRLDHCQGYCQVK